MKIIDNKLYYLRRNYDQLLTTAAFAYSINYRNLIVCISPGVRPWVLGSPDRHVVALRNGRGDHNTCYMYKHIDAHD